VSSRSGVATLRTAIHLLLTYFLTYLQTCCQCCCGRDRCDWFRTRRRAASVVQTSCEHRHHRRLPPQPDSSSTLSSRSTCTLASPSKLTLEADSVSSHGLFHFSAVILFWFGSRQEKNFITARRYASAVFAIVMCPSVCHKPALH